MPILRKSVNRAVKKYSKAKKNSKGWIIDNEGRFFDREGVKKSIKTKDKLLVEMQKRRQGVVGLTRKLVAGKKANERRRDIETIKKLRARGVKIVDPKKEATQTHPLLKEKQVGDEVKTISLRGNIRKGRIVYANLELVGLRSKDGKIANIKLDRLKKIE